ncbi:hypothetical protein PF006_g10646 [Phytophthora fragariae]|uniref:Uncharacterized protein n=1 Tax=Phytophthora fragariae TaxID=53985 RepID=A0A6A3TZ18_9STRA|nr:hypothetical protein PF006_g10646 [Phytophthora fragariae]
MEPLKVWESLIGKKRSLSDPRKNDNSERSKQRLEDSFAVDSTTSPDETIYGKKLSIKEYKEYNGENEARRGVKSGNDDDMDKDLSNADNDAKLIIYEFFEGLRKANVDIAFELHPVINTTEGTSFHQSYYFAKPTKTRLIVIKNSEDGKQAKAKDLSNLMRNISWMDTFTALMDGFQYLEKYLSELDHMKSNEKDAQANLTKNLEILDRVLRKHTKSTEDTSRVKEQSIDPYVSLRLLHDEAEAAFKEYGEAMKNYELAKQVVKTNRSKAAMSNLKAATAAMRATKANYNIKLKRYSLLKQGYPDMNLDEFDEIAKAKVERATTRAYFNQLPQGSGLKGRGLRGAGVAKLDGVIRCGRTYNLNEIQGLATPSAYVYRQLGSKCIRLPDLDAKTLVIVQPNRRKCGPKCQISDSLQTMIRTLVYKNHIDQAAYDKLSIDDKKLFKEILAITHLQYSFHDKLTDPLETLRAEYDKLKGEMELGNDNPSIIKQLKSLTVDMYSNRMIDDKEFKESITRLL